MARLPRLSAARLARALRHAGFREDRQKGSHLTMIHPGKRLRVVIPMHPGDMTVGLIHDIIKQAGLSADDLRELLE